MIGDAAWTHAMTAGAVGTVIGALATLIVGALLYRLALNHAGRRWWSVVLSWLALLGLITLPVEIKTSTPGLLLLGLAFLSAVMTTIGVTAAWVFTFQPNAAEPTVDPTVLNRITSQLEDIGERMGRNPSERYRATAKALKQYAGQDLTVYLNGSKVRGQLVDVNDWDDRERPTIELQKSDGSRTLIYCNAITGFTSQY